MTGHTSSLVFLQYLTTVFDTITDGILLISVETPDTYRLALANRTFFDFSGYPEQSVGKEISEIVSPEAYDFVVEKYKKVVTEKRPQAYLRWAEVPAGLRAFDVRLVPIFNTTGDCAQIAGIVQDATEREQLREEVERLRKTVRGIRASA